MKFTNGDKVVVIKGDHANLVGTIGGYDINTGQVEVIFEDLTVMMDEDNLSLVE